MDSIQYIGEHLLPGQIGQLAALFGFVASSLAAVAYYFATQRRGTKEEADESAHRINKLHEVINGTDSVTGGYYDALNHEQLLWVHACLQISSIYFYEKTVRKLTQEEKDQYHKENT